MRIIAGSLKGRTLSAPPGMSTRPTTDSVREMIFSLLDHHVTWAGRHIIDLCCGSGALGFEALSRGAAHCTFVDSSPAVMALVQETADSFGLSERTTFVRSDVISFLKQRGPGSADVVFADPPYADRLCTRIANGLLKLAILTPGGIYVGEHGDTEIILPAPEWTTLAHKERGQTVVDVLRYDASLP